MSRRRRPSAALPLVLAALALVPVARSAEAPTRLRGRTDQGRAVSLLVAPGGRTVTELRLTWVARCPSASLTNRTRITAIAVHADGRLAGRTRRYERALRDGLTQEVAVTFTGRIAGRRAAGTWRASATIRNRTGDVAQTCRLPKIGWSARR